MVRTQIQLTDEQAQKLKKIAMKRGSSMAEVIRQAVDRIIEKTEFPSDDQIKRRALEAAGRFHAGSRDLARRHDDYLADDYL
ncbi:MAG TPA: ribbon-helix-helix protein, CopG family [Spirochaetes bacterium]|nr:ribbon-helix-helix protein, CopG family [Spirochaetota bacterium]